MPGSREGSTFVAWIDDLVEHAGSDLSLSLSLSLVLYLSHSIAILSLLSQSSQPACQPQLQPPVLGPTVKFAKEDDSHGHQIADGCQFKLLRENRLRIAR